ncbi:uncharacterized protein MONBRDRAFT_9807 [Monosiga brevicollis MX1]|uniref:RING-CH-type domain-containing protein n=1 Tax=Monosiga brevicollis TaxID=81824 RepID=A9V4A5_MONBE|nr:uncharacterized protein MONBRDRAFT_9807 [Monosiga brevicollis MX1]EDQ87675.1 predicted protein [Monosiga brevicollis MX1]|eukprot:XP_001747595.1 hypothetical protein [Monosiga brevicollis MX1]
MGVAGSTLAVRPWYPPEPELTGHQLQALNVLRISVLGWAISSYIKAVFLSPQRRNGHPLFLETPPDRVATLIRNFSFFSWYMSLRLLFSSQSSSSSLRWLAKQCQGLSANAVASITITAELLFDELSYAICLISHDAKAELYGRPLNPRQQPELFVCCICHDNGLASPLYTFCQESEAHLAHWSCMMAWYESDANLAKQCPLCRGGLKTIPTPVTTRVLTLLQSKRFWAGLLRRCAVVAGSNAASLLIFLLMFGLQTLRRQMRPGYVHGQALSKAIQQAALQRTD